MNGSWQESRSLTAAAGLIAGPAAWMANTTLNFVVVTYDCTGGPAVVPLMSGAMLALSLAGGVLSWRAWHAVPPERQSQGGVPVHMLAVSGAFAGLLFAFVILLQAAAGIMFSGCER
jgi:hypothetical protein